MEAVELFLTLSSGYGDGYGDGYGYLIKYNNHKVHTIDGIQTIIYSVKRNIAKCSIINADLTLNDCYVARSGNYFAHGKTAKEAINDARNKEMSNSPIESRIELFHKTFKAGTKYPAQLFYDWHTTLTGSCSLGKESFVKNNGIDMAAKYTISEFIAMTKDAYGSDVIKLLLP